MKSILFNAEMVRAILDERKTTTRRIIKPQPTDQWTKPTYIEADRTWREGWARVIKPPYQSGDVLYVRETWADLRGLGFGDDPITDKPWDFAYKADIKPGSDSDRARIDYGVKWRPSIHMPKEAARIFLRVVRVRSERVQDITEDGEKAEGMVYTDFGMYQPKWKASIDGGKTFHPAKEAHYFGWHSGNAKRPEDCFPTPRGAFAHLWDSTVKKSDLDRFGWAANPWVWNIEFERIGRETEKTA